MPTQPPLLKRGEFQHVWFDRILGKWRPRHSKNTYGEAEMQEQMENEDSVHAAGGMRSTENGYSFKDLQFSGAGGGSERNNSEETQRGANGSGMTQRGANGSGMTQWGANGTGAESAFEVWNSKPSNRTVSSSSSLRRMFEVSREQVDILLNAIPPKAYAQMAKRQSDAFSPKGDMIDAIFEFVFYCKYGWVPEANEDKAKKWKAYFKQQFMVFLTGVIDPMPNDMFSNPRKPQSELPLADFTPKLLVGTDPMVSFVPTRLLVTPLCRGGKSIVTPELLDLVAFALGKVTGWSKSRPSTPFDIENGSFELPLILVPEEPVRLWSSTSYELYQAPLYTILERTHREGQLTLLQEIAYRNNTWTSEIPTKDGSTIKIDAKEMAKEKKIEETETKDTWPIMRKVGNRYGVDPVAPKDLPMKLLPGVNMSNYY